MTERWDMGNRKRTPVALEESHFVVNALESLGYRPDDIMWVVVSHLHEDHAGGLEFFRKSRILVSDQEFTQTMRMYGLGRTSGGYIKRTLRPGWQRNLTGKPWTRRKWSCIRASAS